MVRHYALLYGLHTLPNMLIKPLREAHGFVYVYKPLVLTTVYRQVTVTWLWQFKTAIDKLKMTAADSEYGRWTQEILSSYWGLESIDDSWSLSKIFGEFNSMKKVSLWWSSLTCSLYDNFALKSMRRWKLVQPFQSTSVLHYPARQVLGKKYFYV